MGEECKMHLAEKSAAKDVEGYPFVITQLAKDQDSFKNIQVCKY